MDIDSIIPVIHPEKYQFYITVGLPGTGKTTFCKKLVELCPPENAKVISRDFWRTSLVWGMKKLGPIRRRKIEKNMDDLVTDKVIEELHYILLYKPSVRIIAFDGCHTLYADLKWMLNKIRRLCFELDIKYEMNLVLVGTPQSDCNHALTNKKKGDYSDYMRDGCHKALPEEVFDLKRRQFEALVQHTPFHDIASFCEHVIIVPAYISSLAAKEEKWLGPDLPDLTPRKNLYFDE